MGRGVSQGQRARCRAVRKPRKVEKKLSMISSSKYESAKKGNGFRLRVPVPEMYVLLHLSFFTTSTLGF